MNEGHLQAMLVAASDLEVGQALTVWRCKETEALIESLICLFPERTFFIKPHPVSGDKMELSRLMYEPEEIK